MLKIALTIAAFVVHTAALAQATPVGLWKTIDDSQEGKVAGACDGHGVLSGRIGVVRQADDVQSAATSARASPSSA
jgi:hypothetical protein